MTKKTEKLKKIFDREVLPLLNKIQKRNKYYEVFKTFATNKKAKTGRGIRESELSPSLLPARSQLIKMGRAHIIKINKPKGNNKSWFDKINNKVYPKWRWNPTLEEYKQKLLEHIDKNGEIKEFLKNILNISKYKKLITHISEISNVGEFNLIVEKLIKHKTLIKGKGYGPLEWRNNPYTYTLEDYFIDLTLGLENTGGEK